MGEEAPPPTDPVAVPAVLRRVERSADLLRAVAEARRRRGLTNDDVLVLIAVGSLGFAGGDGRMVVCRPATCKDVADELAMPRETVRRRLGRLADLRLIDFDRRGATMKDLDAWFDLTAPLVADRPA